MTERSPNPFRAPEHDELEPVAGINTAHTTIFGLLFLVMLIGAPLFLGGFLGLLSAPVLGAMLWGLYRATLPSGPKQASIAETAGSNACPSCGSLQTDRRRDSTATQPAWRCFACDHEW